MRDVDVDDDEFRKLVRMKLSDAFAESVDALGRYLHEQSHLAFELNRSVPSINAPHRQRVDARSESFLDYRARNLVGFIFRHVRDENLHDESPFSLKISE
jgi:hypothetical protein